MKSTNNVIRHSKTFGDGGIKKNFLVGRKPY